jgi:hypothetical protein
MMSKEEGFTMVLLTKVEVNLKSKLGLKGEAVKRGFRQSNLA